jgi:hypothetical protein
MSTPVIRTTISTNEIWDLDGKHVPAGNYYFTIHSYRNGIVVGELTHRGSYGTFVFSPLTMIKMMAVAQARLARRCNLHQEDGMPSYSSPVPSSRRTVLPRISLPPPPSSRPTRPPRPTQSAPSHLPRPTSPPLCSICLEPIVSQGRTLSCSHVFHNSCINRWFQSSARCPLCRRSHRRLPRVSNAVPFQPPRRRHAPSSFRRRMYS